MSATPLDTSVRQKLAQFPPGAPGIHLPQLVRSTTTDRVEDYTSVGVFRPGGRRSNTECLGIGSLFFDADAVDWFTAEQLNIEHPAFKSATYKVLRSRIKRDMQAARQEVLDRLLDEHQLRVEQVFRWMELPFTHLVRSGYGHHVHVWLPEWATTPSDRAAAQEVTATLVERVNRALGYGFLDPQAAGGGAQLCRRIGTFNRKAKRPQRVRRVGGDPAARLPVKRLPFYGFKPVPWHQPELVKRLMVLDERGLLRDAKSTKPIPGSSAGFTELGFTAGAAKAKSRARTVDFETTGISRLRRGQRMCCPVHGGDNDSAVGLMSPGKAWCFTHCGLLVDSGLGGTEPQEQESELDLEKLLEGMELTLDEMVARATAERDWASLLALEQAHPELEQGIAWSIFRTDARRRILVRDTREEDLRAYGARVDAKKAAAAALDPVHVESAGRAKAWAKANVSDLRDHLKLGKVVPCGFVQGLVHAGTSTPQAVGRQCGKPTCARCRGWHVGLRLGAVLHVPIVRDGVIVGPSFSTREVWTVEVPRSRLEAWKRRWRRACPTFRQKISTSSFGGKSDIHTEAAHAYVVFNPPSGDTVAIMMTADIGLPAQRARVAREPTDSRPARPPRPALPAVAAVQVDDVEVQVLRLGKWAHRGSSGRVTSSHTLALDPEGILKVASASPWVMEAPRLESLSAVAEAMDEEDLTVEATEGSVKARELVPRRVRERIWHAARRKPEEIHLDDPHEDPAVSDILDTLTSGTVIPFPGAA